MNNVAQVCRMPDGRPLTDDQLNGVRTILDFMEDEDSRTLVLQGYAGTGKTTLIQAAVKYMGSTVSVAFTAPTNKATKVLRAMADNAGVSIEHVATIYSLLGLVLKPNGEVKQINRHTSSMSGAFDLVVIDEASMVNEALMRFIEEDMHDTSTKFIFMGDPLQLPPIGEELSRSFTSAEYHVELNEIVRQAADNPIIQLTADIRAAIKRGDSRVDFATKKAPNGEGVFVLPRQQWEVWMQHGFKSAAYAEDGDAFRAVAWRNVAVDAYNARIRRALYGDGANSKFIVGERVINAAPITDLELEEILAATDSEGVVRSVDIAIHPLLQRRKLGDFKVYHLAISYEDVGLLDAYALHEDSERAYNAKLNALSDEAKKDKRLWSTFWFFKDAFHDIRPAHAITSHRSQGSTYDNCFVDVQDIMRNRNRTEALKSLYVACSRARKNLMLLT